MSATKLLSFVKKLFRFIGQNLFESNLCNLMTATFSLISLVVILILSVMEPFMFELNIEKITGSSETFGPYFQCVTKVIVHKFYQELVKNLVYEMDEKFWPVNKFGAELERKQNKILNFLYHSSILLYASMLSTGFVISLKPFWTEARVTPFACYAIWDYSNTPYYITIYMMQIINIYVGCTLVTAYDSLFIDIVARFLNQIMMLRAGLKTLNLGDINTEEEENERFKTLKEYVIHHCMLLRLFEDIKKIYSVILLTQFLASTASLCIGLYSLSVGRGNNLLLVVRGFIITFTFMFQLFIYCIAGSLIGDECVKVAESTFYSDWQEPCGRRLRHGVGMIIIRAQKPQILSGGGILHASLTTFGRILQFSISFYTLMSKSNVQE